MSSFQHINSEEYAKLKMRISELENKVEFLLTNLKLEYVAPEGDNFDDLKQMAAEGKVMDAIKIYRDRTKATMEAARKFFGLE